MREPFGYSITVQWSNKYDKYEAFVPTLMPHVRIFVPDHPVISFGSTPDEAISSAMWQAKLALRKLKKLAILPPASDIGTNLLEGFHFEEIQKKKTAY